MSTENKETEMPTETPSNDYTVIHERLTGTVKWFNNKAGFGFITVCEEGEYKDKDIFVHYSSIRVSNSQYKYLVQGEYVDFTLVKANNGHEFQAMHVSGIKGGPIMCESRRVMTPIGFQPRESQNGPPANKPSKKNENTKNIRNKPTQEPNTDESLLGYTTVSKKRRTNRTNQA
jgi:cold shock protein